MSDRQVVGIGRAMALVGVVLELRHLAGAIVVAFAGCSTVGQVITRLVRLDDATLIGVAACAILAIAIVASYIKPRRTGR